MENIFITTAENFSFKSTLYSHGWSDLPPFQLVEKPIQINYAFGLSYNKNVYLQIGLSTAKRLKISCSSTLNVDEKHQLSDKIKRIFRLDEDYSEFYNLAEKSKEFSWVLEYGSGRMLRAASLWEDMVKMLCTTNCTWRLTQIMVENLVTKLGSTVISSNVPANTKTFPNAQSVAKCDENYLRNQIKMGYRAPYLLEFAQAVAGNKLELNTLEDKSLSTEEVYKQIRGIKGFGDYAVSNLLKLLGRYDYLGADSWSRKKFFEKHRKGKPCDDKKIHAHYKKFGKWSGLFFWMDVIEHWYREENAW